MRRVVPHLTLSCAALAACLPQAPGESTSSSYVVDFTGDSADATWTCTGTPCPWGDSIGNPAIAWPDAESPVDARLGYTVAPAAYLPAGSANGLTIVIESGAAGVYSGGPQDPSHSQLAWLSAGDAFAVSGLAGDEVLSVQSDSEFAYHVLPTPDAPPGGGSGGDPGDGSGSGSDPGNGSGSGSGGGDPNAIWSVQALWRCNIPECVGDDWTGAVIAWPSWAAYQSNARAGDQSRSVFDTDGAPLYPYMGPWAQGCTVTVHSGVALIIEWQRGTDTWRETGVEAGQSHTIDLVSPEDSAMIETYDGYPNFSVTLDNCTPQPLAPPPP
jgi:hypothetical protein